MSTVEKLAYRPQEAAHAVGLSRARIYELMAEGRLAYVQVDGTRLIPAAELNKLIGVGDGDDRAAR
jgi:excisionase family DNA binding protein